MENDHTDVKDEHIYIVLKKLMKYWKYESWREINETHLV